MAENNDYLILKSNKGSSYLMIMFKCPVITQSGLSVKNYYISTVFKEQNVRTDNLKAALVAERPAGSRRGSMACKSGTCSAGRASPVTDAVTYETNPLYNVPILLFDADESASVSGHSDSPHLSHTI